MSRVAAVILAGGKGERLGGVSKAEIEIGGVRLIERVRLALSGCDPILIAAGASAIALHDARSVPDLDSDYGGPLAGVAAAVAALAGSDSEWLLSAAVDTPFFPADFATRATALAGTADVVLGCFGSQDYPTNALWRLHALRSLPQAVLDGSAPHSLRRLAAGLKLVRLDYAASAHQDPFANANTPEDLANLRARDSRTTPG